MIFRRMLTQKSHEDCIEDQRLSLLFLYQKELDATRTPDFSKMMVRAKSRPTGGRRRFQGLSAFPGSKRAVFLALGLLLMLAGGFIVQRFGASPQTDFGIYGAARDLVNWQSPSLSLFTSSPNIWFLEDNWDWQGPTDDLLKMSPKISFTNGNS